MNERLYCLRPDPAVFDTGTARAKQILLFNNVDEISLLWFAPNGEFLELERIPIAPATMPPGSRQWRDGTVVAERLRWAWGLYDMHGNVHEWCADSALSDDRMCRGGAFCSQSRTLRSADRFHSVPRNRISDTGFRAGRTASS
jgi:hypothetical protein